MFILPPLWNPAVRGDDATRPNLALPLDLAQLQGRFREVMQRHVDRDSRLQLLICS
jgi:hypothetical protein